MVRDLRFGARMLLKEPGFALITVLTLALGIGATAAVFSLVQGVLLTRPPYRQPDRLVLIPAARADGQEMTHPREWAAVQWMEWQKEAKSFEAIGAYSWGFDYLVLPDGSASMEGMYVTQDYFRAVGLQPMLGRTFVETETGVKSPAAIILGYDLWQKRFGGDRNIIGKTIRISRWETPPRVIGVMPEGVRFLPSPGTAKEPNYNVDAHVDYWVPVNVGTDHLRREEWDVVGRLRSGITVGQAQAELTILTAREAQADREFRRYYGEGAAA